MRAPFDPYGAASPAIDQQLGDAFQVVRYVARHIPEIASVAYHMEGLYKLVSAGGKANADLVGLEADAVNLGNFEGDILLDDSTIKSSLQVLATYLQNLKESTDASFNDMGDFTGSTIPDNLNLHDALQVIEDAIERVFAEAPVLSTEEQAEAGTDNSTVMSPLRVAQAISAQVSEDKASAASIGVAGNSDNMGEWSSDLLTDNGTLKAAVEEVAEAVVNAASHATYSDETTYPEGSVGSALHKVPASAREVNPELPISTFMQGHESDADHTARFNEAIDKLNAVTGQKGGTIRLDAFEYKVASVQAIRTGATYIKGVGSPEVRVNVADAINQAKGWGTVITLLAGTGDAFTWSDKIGSGYDLGGGGMSDLSIFGDDRTGYPIVMNRVMKPTIENVGLWRPWNGIQFYGGIYGLLGNVSINQIRGNHAFNFIGDADNRADAVSLHDCFFGCQDATTGNYATGILWQGFAHSMQIRKTQIVNPAFGMLCQDNGLSTANDFMRPHFLRSFGLEVDFAQNACVRLENFRDFEFIGGYHHSAGLTTCFEALEHMVGDSNRNGQLRVAGGNFSNGGNFGQIYTNCNDSSFIGCTVQPPAIANANGIYVGPLAQKTKIHNNGIGETHVYTNPTGTAGIRIANGALKTSATNNDFYNCAVAIVDATASGESIITPNSIWGV